MKTGPAVFSWLLAVPACGGSILLGNDPWNGDASPGTNNSHGGSSSGGSLQPPPAGAFSGGSSGILASSGAGSSSGMSNSTTASSSGSSGAANSDASTAMVPILEPTLPTATGACPTLTGLSGATVTINDSSGPDGGHPSGSDAGHASGSDGGPAPGPDGSAVSGPDGGDAGNGQTVVVWSGQRKPGAGAPILFYWHGTGSTPQEAQAFMGAQLSEIASQGGLVAAFASTTGTGANTSGEAVFYADDFKTADQIVACAVQQLNIDVHRIYTAGCSAGGLQAGAMLYYRSSYLAAAMPNSGGTFLPMQLEDPRHVPALMTAHGAAGTDLVVLDFSQTSLSECADVKAKGGFAVDCNHGGGHCGAPADLIAAQWQFCKDHPFGVASDPYSSGLPTSFPSYCVIQ